MRSRYVAYAEQRMDYLRDSWHPDTRPARLEPDLGTEWRRLEIISSNEDGNQGAVHFRATWQTAERWGALEEMSRFIKVGGRWFYHGGDVIHHNLKPGRNDPCPCGSGNKYKKCCASS